MNRDLNYLEDVLNSIEKIEVLCKDVNFETFMKNYHIHDAVMFNFIVIGEATNRLSKGFKENHGNVVWHKLYGMRNHLAHSYDDINYKTVWKAVTVEMIDLKSEIQKLIKEQS